MRQQITYYQKRAKEYELIYDNEDRQHDLKEIKSYLGKQFLDKDILEIACGTGYWTKVLAKKVKSIVATDVNQTVIDIARQKKYPRKNVFYKKIDYRELDQLQSTYDGLFGGFIWSHIAKQKFEHFLTIISSRLNEGAELIFIDNKYVHGKSTPLSRQDSHGNTYQKRTLHSGEEFEVIKNFPKKHETNFLLLNFAEDIEWIELEYYWILKFNKK